MWFLLVLQRRLKIGGPTAYRANCAPASPEGPLQQARALQHSPALAGYRRFRATAEHRLVYLNQLGMRKAHYFGRTKTKCPLVLAITVTNFDLVVDHIGGRQRSKTRFQDLNEQR